MGQGIAGQVVLITGASYGIGAGLARQLANRFTGIRLILAARSFDRLEEIAADCRKAGAEVLVIPTDMTQTEQVQALAAKAIAQFGRVDAIVSNAGYGQMGPVELIPAEATERQFQVNVFGPLTLIRALIPTMRSQGGGRIILISSLGGRMAFPFGGMYSASKFALESLGDVLRMELEPFKIRVSIVEPGPVQTEFFSVVNQAVAETITDPQNTPYRSAFAKLEHLDRQVNSRAWSCERVADVIIRALSDRRPRPRYVAATGGSILLFLMTKVLPTWFTDRFWQRFYGINLVAKEWQARELTGSSAAIDSSAQIGDPDVIQPDR
ncbi:MAG: SDR family oxidoreductase [Leptolyngbyaceae cyanobacterium SM1_3_5]|nr:SDR family oxidoreductase [Leptolyngbyaceae cyanobacterium SM1_3_5]